MSAEEVLTRAAFWLLTFLVVTLVGIAAWVGRNVMARMDEFSRHTGRVETALESLNEKLATIVDAQDILRDTATSNSERVGRLEGRLDRAEQDIKDLRTEVRART